MKSQILYVDDSITVTENYIGSRLLQDQVVLIDECTDVQITRMQIGDYNAPGWILIAAGLIMLIVFYPIGIWLLLMAIAAFIKKIMRYEIVVTWKGYHKTVASTSDKNSAKAAKNYILAAIWKLQLLQQPQRAL